VRKGGGYGLERVFSPKLSGRKLARLAAQAVIKITRRRIDNQT